MSHQQPRLIIEDINEALIELVQATGGWKECGFALRPDLAPDRAGDWLRAALNSDRREALQPSQIVALLRRVHTAVAWLLEALSYAPPVPVLAADESLNLRRDIAANMERMTKMLARLEQLEDAR